MESSDGDFNGGRYMIHGSLVFPWYRILVIIFNLLLP